MVYTCRMRANCIWRRKKCILICALLIQNDANMQMRLVNFTIFQDLVTKKEKGSVFHFIHFATIIYNVHMFSCKIWNLVLVWTFSILTHAVIWVPFPPPICFTTSPCSYDFLLAQWKVSIAINVSNMFYCVVSLICNYYMNKNWNLPGIRTNDPDSERLEDSFCFLLYPLACQRREGCGKGAREEGGRGLERRKRNQSRKGGRGGREGKQEQQVSHVYSAYVSRRERAKAKGCLDCHLLPKWQLKSTILRR